MTPSLRMRNDQQHDPSNFCSLWLENIQETTNCIGKVYASEEERENAVGMSIKHLIDLEQLLGREPSRWNRLPSIRPLPLEETMMPNAVVPQANPSPPQKHTTSLHSNPFHSLQDEDEEEETDDGGDEICEFEGSLGGTPTTNTGVVVGMVVRRLLIRILTAHSELLVYKAGLCRRNTRRRPHPSWKEGAELCAMSVNKIRTAMELADEEISRRLLALEHTRNKNYGMAQKTAISELMADADIVDVARQSIADERDGFLRAAKQYKANLENRLSPQWKTRDEVRARLGDSRWCNNPNPKNDYARIRTNDETHLKELCAALEIILALEMDHLQEESQQLKTRLQEGTVTADEGQRYNGQRPTDTSRHVSIFDYPDPTEYGWFFTGSVDNVVEFFERTELDGSLVKLDWYFTTGTIKTSLDHPKHGKTQMFGAKVTPDIYKLILENPRAHTNQQRYRERRHARNNPREQPPRARGGGRGRGRVRAGRGRGRGRRPPPNNPTPPEWIHPEF